MFLGSWTEENLTPNNEGSYSEYFGPTIDTINHNDTTGKKTWNVTSWIENQYKEDGVVSIRLQGHVQVAMTQTSWSGGQRSTRAPLTTHISRSP